MDITSLPGVVSEIKAGLPAPLASISVPSCSSELRAWTSRNKARLLRDDPLVASSDQSEVGDAFTRRFHAQNFDSLCRLLTAAESYEDLRRGFEHNMPDLIIHDSNERASILLGQDLNIPVWTIPSRADFTSSRSLDLEDRTLAFFDLDHKIYTSKSNAVISIGPRRLYGTGFGSRDYHVQYKPEHIRVSGGDPLENVDAVFSFGTFVLEPPVEVLLDLIQVLISEGRNGILMKLRDQGLRENLSRNRRLPKSVRLVSDVDILKYVSPGVLYVGHGSLIGTMEALNAGANVYLIPSQIADHNWVAERCRELQWDWRPGSSGHGNGPLPEPKETFQSLNEQEEPFLDLFTRLSGDLGS